MSIPPWSAAPRLTHVGPTFHAQRRSLRGLVQALTVLFSVMAVILLINAGGLFYRAHLFAEAAHGRFYTYDQAAAADTIVDITTVLFYLLFVAIGVVFIIWQYRHAKNASALGARGGLVPGWAIGGWFIPLANLVLPAVQMFQASKASYPEPHHVSRPHGRGAGIVIAWAILFGLGQSLTRVAVAVFPGYIETPEDFDAASQSDVLEGLGALVLIAAAVIATLMVRSLSTRQDQAFVQRAVTAFPGHPAQSYAGPPVGYSATGQPPAGMPWTVQSLSPPSTQAASAPPSAEPDPNHDPWRSPPA